MVTVSSGAHRMGKIRFSDLQSEESYKPWRAYGQSKLANLLFCFELQRRADNAGSALISTAAHPGYAATNLQTGTSSKLQDLVMGVLNKVVAQSAEAGRAADAVRRRRADAGRRLRRSQRAGGGAGTPAAGRRLGARPPTSRRPRPSGRSARSSPASATTSVASPPSR